MIKVQASVSKGWLNKHGGFEFGRKYYLDPFYRMQQDSKCNEFIKGKFPDYPLYNMEDNLVQAEYVVPDMMLVGAIQPNMIIAAALGAEFVKSIHSWITDVYITVIRYFSELGNLPLTSVHVGECSGTMLDKHSYREFVTPYISRLGREFGCVRLHSCGNADHVMDAICEVENLEIIDTGSNTSLKAIRDKMGRDFEINVFPPVEVLGEGSRREAIARSLDRTLEDNDGGNLKIEYHLEPGYNLDNCIFIHEELDKRGLVRKGRLY